MTSAPNIYAIIVTYNGMQWIERCLSSLRQSSVPVTPVVVDNASADGTIAYIQAHYPEAILLLQNTNLGFGQANNKGLEYAIAQDASHVLLLNQDAYLQPDTLAALLAYNDDRHLLTPVHLNGIGDHIDSLFYNRTILENAPSNCIVEDMLLHDKANDYYDVAYANAACWLLPVALIRRIGGFNPLFAQYGEDDNYIQRLHYHHYGIRMVTTAYVYHDRQAHGHEVIYKRGVLYRKLLLIKTNINLSRTQRIVLKHKTAFQELGHALYTHQFVSFIREWMSAKWKICANFHCIRKSRCLETTNSSPWLNI